MPNRIDVTGHRYGRLLVLEELPQQRVRVICDCGTEKTVTKAHVRTGATVSCGCYNREVIKVVNKTHGLAKTPEWESWRAMRHRCLGKNASDYQYYGGRGITICERWNKFENFLADMGVRPGKEYSLDRIDNSAGYSPENCRWATKRQQSDNRRDKSNSHWIAYGGVVKTLNEWALLTGMGITTLSRRIKVGWDVEDAIARPIDKKHHTSTLQRKQ